MKVTFDKIFSELEMMHLVLGRFIDHEQLKKLARAYYERMPDIDSFVFSKACRFWDKDKLPTIHQLIDKCKELAKYKAENDEMVVRMADLVCDHMQYFLRKNFEQSITEAGLCMRKSISDIERSIANAHNGLQQIQLDAAFSKTGYGLILCPWHQALARARHEPGGVDDIYCATMVNNGHRPQVIDLTKTANGLFAKIA